MVAVSRYGEPTTIFMPASLTPKPYKTVDDFATFVGNHHSWEKRCAERARASVAPDFLIMTYKNGVSDLI
jgi:hypothetical protein